MSDGINKEYSGTAMANDEKPNDGDKDLDSLGVNDAGVLPKGSIDPVYEAKARVLNRAVSIHSRI
jgi:hypothetical protein